MWLNMSSCRIFVTLNVFISRFLGQFSSGSVDELPCSVDVFFIPSLRPVFCSSGASRSMWDFFTINRSSRCCELFLCLFLSYPPPPPIHMLLSFSPLQSHTKHSCFRFSHRMTDSNATKTVQKWKIEYINGFIPIVGMRLFINMHFYF